MLVTLLRRIRYWLASDRGQADLEDEMRLHVALRAEKLRASGMEYTEAHATARRGFGNQLQLQERSREMWITRWVDDVARDVRIALRGLGRSPGFTIVALLTLGSRPTLQYSSWLTPSAYARCRSRIRINWRWFS